MVESKIDEINALFRDMLDIEKTGNKWRQAEKIIVPIVVGAATLAVGVLTRGLIQPKPWMGGVVNNWNRGFQQDMRDKLDWSVSAVSFLVLGYKFGVTNGQG